MLLAMLIGVSSESCSQQQQSRHAQLSHGCALTRLSRNTIFSPPAQSALLPANLTESTFGPQRCALADAVPLGLACPLPTWRTRLLEAAGLRMARFLDTRGLARPP